MHWFDLLGYGRSAKPEVQDVSLGVQNRVLAALLDHWQLDRPDVVAHDFGGATALRAHLLDGRDYRSLLLIDPVAIGPSGSPFVQVVGEQEATFSALPAYMHEAMLRAYIGNAVHRELADDELRRYVDPWLGATGQRAFYRQIAQMSDRFTDEVEHRYGELRCPVSILWGAEDAWIPVERGEELARRIPGAALRVVPGAGHLVQEDAPESDRGGGARRRRRGPPWAAASRRQSARLRAAGVQRLTAISGRDSDAGTGAVRAAGALTREHAPARRARCAAGARRPPGSARRGRGRAPEPHGDVTAAPRSSCSAGSSRRSRRGQRRTAGVVPHRPARAGRSRERERAQAGAAVRRRRVARVARRRGLRRLDPPPQGAVRRSGCAAALRPAPGACPPPTRGASRGAAIASRPDGRPNERGDR